MPDGAVDRYDDEMRSFVESLLRFESTQGNEAPAQRWFADALADLGFETFEWTADAEKLAEHPSFPDDPAEIQVADRPSVGGVLEVGDADRGPTVVLNGHMDVVPVDRDSWSSDPFEPTWSVDGTTLTARGAVDMKAALTACVYAAQAVAETDAEIDGRVVVESVSGEEEGGIGAAAAALSNPYPFERDAAIIAEPTDLGLVTATEGCLMMRLWIKGRSAHAATRWRGESVIPHFIELFEELHELERERAEAVTHPLYGRFDIPWPVNVGKVRAGSWTSTVPADLEADIRIGVAPGETVAEVEESFTTRIAAVARDDPWLAEHPPSFERISIQFEPGEVAVDEAIVRSLQAAMEGRGLDATPRGETYGADQRHYLEADIPTVVFGPGTIDQAHYPDETIEWEAVSTATETLADATTRYLASNSD